MLLHEQVCEPLCILTCIVVITDHCPIYSLHNLVQVSGPSPIPPRYAFGVYYSRYHAYNDVGEKVSIIMIPYRHMPFDAGRAV